MPGKGGESSVGSKEKRPGDALYGKKINRNIADRHIGGGSMGQSNQDLTRSKQKKKGKNREGAKLTANDLRSRKLEPRRKKRDGLNRLHALKLLTQTEKTGQHVRERTTVAPQNPSGPRYLNVNSGVLPKKPGRGGD